MQYPPNWDPNLQIRIRRSAFHIIWTERAAAFWPSRVFGASGLERIGLVGDQRWERWIRRACRPLKCPVRSFESIEKSLKWLLEKRDTGREAVTVPQKAGDRVLERVQGRFEEFGF